MTAQPASRLAFTAEDYFAWEETQAERHDFYQGEVFAMSGGTFQHALLTMNFGSEIRNALRGRPCLVLSPDMRVQLGDGTFYVYPDVSVVCGTPQFRNDDQRTLLNPVLVVEVLSKSTAAYDRGLRFQAYRRLPSLREVVFVSQNARTVEVMRRGDDDRWTLFEPEDGRIALASVEVALTLDALYEGLDLPDEEPPPEAERR